MISILKLCMGLACALALSACGASIPASRAAMPDDTMLGMIQPDYRVESFTVSVPKSLTVNERNSYYPRGDIVWRGDTYGDRHAQVEAIFDQALRNAASSVDGARPVRVDVQVMRFHALSEKARYSVGGIHDITFRLRLADPVTGAIIAPSKVVDADLDALSGQGANVAEARGDTQKNRIIAHLTLVFQEELSVPGGHQNAKLGLLQQINDL